MEQKQEKRSGILGGVAKALNSTGSAIVISYDSTSNMIGTVFSKVKTVVPSLPDTARDLFSGIPSLPGSAMDFFSGARDLISGGFRKLKTDEELDIEKKIGDYKDKIKSAYYEIGREGASAEKLESEAVQKLINDVKEYEKEIQRLEGRAVEIEDLKQESIKSEERTLNKKVSVSESRVMSSVSDAIEKAVNRGEFETDSDRAIFDKIAHDLLDNEMEIKILSASELGKIGNRAAVPVLHEAIKFDNPYLASEIINALINLEDAKSIKLFRDMATDQNYRVRMVSLRGLYKLGDDKEIETILIDALKDSHPEVRKSAITFIGWKDYHAAVPGLIQTLQDKEEKVRQASVAALANIKDSSSVLPLMRILADKNFDIREKALEAIKMITGKEIVFNVELQENALMDAINNLKEDWQKERLSQYTASDVGISEVARGAEDAVVTEKEEEVKETVEPAEEESGFQELKEKDEAAPEEEMSSEEGKDNELNEESLTDSQLINMNKGKLLALCEERNIDCDDNMTKAEIRDLLSGQRG